MFDSTDPETFAGLSPGADEAISLIAAGLEMLRSEDRTAWSTTARSERVLELGGLAERVQAELIRAVAVWDGFGDYAADGSLSGTAWLTHRIPTSRIAAARLVSAARVCRRSERMSKALDAGDLTASHVEQIARAIKNREDIFVSHGDVLVDAAVAVPPEEFRVAAARWRALADDEVGIPDAEAVNTMTLTHADGVTTMQTVVLHTTRENRDGHLQSGMEAGMQDTFNRLDDVLAISDSPAERFRRVAGRFTDRVDEVPSDAWDNPAPCAGWVARDVVRHMVEWMPSFLASVGVNLSAVPSVDDDPVGAWTHLADSLQALLDDPATANREITHEHLGTVTVEYAIGMIMFGDIVIHTWDLARATGLDESLDPAIVSEMLAGMLPMDEALRASGQYGPRVTVADDADDQTKLIAFTGRTP